MTKFCVVLLHLIGFEGGASFLDPSYSDAKKKTRQPLNTSDAHLKVALYDTRECVRKRKEFFSSGVKRNIPLRVSELNFSLLDVVMNDVF